MTKVLAAGDHFVAPELFVDALGARAGGRDLEFAELKLPWPVEPFGPVGGVREASGTEQQVLEVLGGAAVAIL